MALLLLRVLVAGAVLLALDAAWIALVAGPAYGRAVAAVQRGAPMRTRVAPSAAAYACIVAALLLILRRVQHLDWAGVAEAAAWGAALYGTYAFTAMAVFDAFPLHLALGDTAWGALLFAASVAAALVVVRPASASSHGKTK